MVHSAHYDFTSNNSIFLSILKFEKTRRFIKTKSDIIYFKTYKTVRFYKPFKDLTGKKTQLSEMYGQEKNNHYAPICKKLINLQPHYTS